MVGRLGLITVTKFIGNEFRPAASGAISSAEWGRGQSQKSPWRCALEPLQPPAPTLNYPPYPPPSRVAKQPEHLKYLQLPGNGAGSAAAVSRYRQKCPSTMQYSVLFHPIFWWLSLRSCFIKQITFCLPPLPHTLTGSLLRLGLGP